MRATSAGSSRVARRCIDGPRLAAADLRRAPCRADGTAASCHRASSSGRCRGGRVVRGVRPHQRVRRPRDLIRASEAAPCDRSLDSIEQVFDAGRMRSGAALEQLGELAERVRPVTLTREQRLPVLPALEGLLPGGGLRRGATVSVGSAPGWAGPPRWRWRWWPRPRSTGSWVAAVGLPSLGLVAADELGVALERLVLVAAPERDAWGGVVAALVDGFDLVVLHAGRTGVRTADARRLVARARERGAVLVQLGPGWPEGADVQLEVTRARWEGLDDGHGHLQARKVRVTGGGRGEAAQPRRVDLWLPGPGGEVVPAAPVEAPVAPGRCAAGRGRPAPSRG